MPPTRTSHYPKPVIGIVGGIGAGKSALAHALEPLGCRVIDSDKVAHEVIQRPAVKEQLVLWWGHSILKPTGEVDRRQVAHHVFGNPQETEKLNHLIHPLVAQDRQRVMREAENDPQVTAIIWDTPLLFEVGLDTQCDAVIFVNVPYPQRLQRVMETRGWTEAQLAAREILQMPLDKKQNLADYVIDNSGEITAGVEQLRRIFSHIHARKQQHQANRPQ